jgi:hypothetical protein
VAVAGGTKPKPESAPVRVGRAVNVSGIVVGNGVSVGSIGPVVERPTPDAGSSSRAQAESSNKMTRKESEHLDFMHTFL